MSLDPGDSQLAVSPVSSGRSTPVNRQSRGKAEDNAFRKDKSYRRYASSVERALALFDTTLQDWADYISFLGRLLKALQTHPDDAPVIPHKGLVSKRLAQCLNPALPAGVHQKCLEVYTYIFATIGVDALSRDLPLYFTGLSSVLSFASLAVRPLYLSLVESYLLPLHGYAVRPALKGIIMALLPGLEEETSEDFERTLAILNGFRDAIRRGDGSDSKSLDSPGDSYFWQCLFLASITSGSRRTGALAFLVRELPKLVDTTGPESNVTDDGHEGEEVGYSDLSEAARAIVSPEPGLLVRCFATGLSDNQILIQRGFLDLLVSHVPLHSSILQKKLPTEGLKKLISAAVSVVARRDMSLNRRLWAWLLGPEPPQQGDEAKSPSANPTENVNGLIGSGRAGYFARYGLKPLVQSILDSVTNDAVVPLDRARPFRICLSLMDRWEVGGLVVPEVFLALMDDARRYKDSARSAEDFQDVLRSANVFFDGVEGGLIWGELNNLLISALGSPSTELASRLQKLSLVDFIISHFNVREEEMLVVHIPLAALSLLKLLSFHESAARAENEVSVPATSSSALGIAERLVAMIPERAFLTGRSNSDSPPSVSRAPAANSDKDETVQQIRSFYELDQGNLDSADPPFSGGHIGEMLLREVSGLVCRSLRAGTAEALIEPKTRLLISLLEKLPNISLLRDLDLFSTITETLSAEGSGQNLPFPTFSAVLSALIALNSALSLDQFSASDELTELCPYLVRHAWSYVSPVNPKYHVEAVHCLWQLHFATSSTHLVEASICQLMTAGDENGSGSCSVDAGQRFAVVWSHSVQAQWGLAGPRGARVQRLNSADNVKHVAGSVGDYYAMLTRPLFIFLDTLAIEGTEVFFCTRSWIQTLPTVDKVLRVFVTKLLPFEFLASDHGTADYEYKEEHDFEQCCYQLQTLSNFLKYSPNTTWTAMTREVMHEDNEEHPITLQAFFTQICMRAISGDVSKCTKDVKLRVAKVQRAALSLLQQILVGPYHLNLVGLELEYPLLDRLMASLLNFDSSIQVSLLDVVFASLKMRLLRTQPIPSPQHRRTTSKDTLKSPSRVSILTDTSEKEQTGALPNPPPPQLVKCLQVGFSTASSRPILDNWVAFLAECLPLFTDTIFEVLLPLVECINGQIREIYASLRSTFTDPSGPSSEAGEATILALLDGVEQILASAHDRLLMDEAKSSNMRSPEQPQGFFGNMVSGVWSSDAPQTRSPTANNRLTVLLAFEDVARICFDIWAWAGHGSETNGQDPSSLASFSFTSLRVRNRARRLLEHLSVAEPLECLETLAEIWRLACNSRDQPRAASVFNLLHVLDGSRPKNTIPAIFNGIYSRTNTSAVEPRKRLALTTDLASGDLVSFLVAYVRTVDDDAMDEIWADCMAFLRDILANPFPHRQTLPGLLEFTALLGEKADNTNFGEQRKMRKDLGDVFTRMLTAAFTTKPIRVSQDSSAGAIKEKPVVGVEATKDGPGSSSQAKADDLTAVLCSIIPNLGKILVESDRITGTATAISTNIIGPAFHAKAFPENVSSGLLALLYQLCRIPSASKSWRRDLSDAFNNARFFCSPRVLVENHWLPLLRQLSMNDKDRLPELLSRISAPTSAGIMFGVGASSARLEADRKTQLNLRRIATLILAADDDTFVVNVPNIVERLVELLSATAASSPSSITRAEIYMVIRALVLKTSPIHLVPLWPILNSELLAAISSLLPEESSDVYNDFTIIHACKLLDVLLLVQPDDFQPHEWLFITDTIDAVYRPSDWRPVALVDEVSESLNLTTQSGDSSLQPDASAGMAKDGLKRPLLNSKIIKAVPGEELLARIIRPFLSELSIYAFESTYSMSAPDLDACKEDLLADLFDESTIAG